MNNMKKIMVFAVALLMVLTVFAAMPAPSKANTEAPEPATVPTVTYLWPPLVTDPWPAQFVIAGVANMAVDAEVEVGTTADFAPGAGDVGVYTTTQDNLVSGAYRVTCNLLNPITTYYWRLKLSDPATPTDFIYYPDATTTASASTMNTGTASAANPDPSYQPQDRPTTTIQNYMLYILNITGPGTVCYPMSLLDDAGNGYVGFTGDNAFNSSTNTYYTVADGDVYSVDIWGYWDDGGGIAPPADMWYNNTYSDTVSGGAVTSGVILTDEYPLVTAHNATATGPTTASSSNVASITITYTNDTGTTSVDLYYTTDGGTTWTLIGSDATIDGSYAWTIPADGTYGWTAVADGEVAPVSGDAPEATPYIYDGTAPTVTSTTPADAATGVAVTTDVVVVFGESMDTTVTPTLTQTAGTVVTYTAGVWSTTNVANDTFTWTHADWALGDSVTLTVDAAQDVAGNAQTAYTWSFTTAADSLSPVVTINSVIAPLEGGAIQTVTATVDDSTTGGSNIVSATYTVIAPSGAVVYDNVSLAADDGTFDSPIENVTVTYDTDYWATGTYTVFVFGSDGNIGSASVSYAEQDTSAPTFAYVLPSDGATVAAEQAIDVYVDIDDANYTSDIDNTTVIMSWTNDSWTNTYTVAMTYDSNGAFNTVKYVGGRWYGAIPAQADGTTISYYVDASDVIPNAATGPIYTITASATSLADPYPVYGYVYLYNGNAGVYNPLLCDGAAYNFANVDVSWVNSSSGATDTLTVTTDSLGRYQVDLNNYTDGGTITVNASDTGLAARYNINTTTIVAANGGSMVNVTFGIPSRLNFTDPTNPPFYPLESSGTGFNVQYTIYDANGVIAPGYYGTVNITTNDTDPSVVLPADLVFDGVGGAVGDGQASAGQVTLITVGFHYLNITDIGNDLTPPAIYPEAGQWWDNITVEVSGLQFTWDLSQPGWHICSVPVVPVASSDSASEITAIIDSVATGLGVTLTDITIANRTGSTPSTYDSYIYGSGGVDFNLTVGSAYWVYVDQGFGIVQIQGNNYTTTTGTFTKNLYAGWNMIGIAHNFTGNGAVDFEANVNPGVAGAGSYVTYSAGTPGQPWPGVAWYVSYWDVGTQKYDTYVYNFNQPTDARNYAISIMLPATGFWLYVPAGGTMTYSVQN